MYIYIYIYVYIYIYIYMYEVTLDTAAFGARPLAATLGGEVPLRPVHLLRVSLLRVLESNFPGDSL